MEMDTVLCEAARKRRLLLLWGNSPFALPERIHGERVPILNRLAKAAAEVPPATELTNWPPLPILSLDPANCIERAFQKKGIPLQVLYCCQEVPRQGQHSLFKLAGDLATRRGLVLSREEVRALWSDADKRYLLEQAGRLVQGGAVLFLGAASTSEDLSVWWPVLLPILQGIALFAPASSAAQWPQGVKCLQLDTQMVASAIKEILVQEGQPDSTERNSNSAPIDYHRGFQILYQRLSATDYMLQGELATLEARFEDNKHREALFDGSENTRSERAQIVHALNEFALAHLGISFVDLCRGKDTPS